MTAEKVKRKLTAILSADVKGYSRMMGADEVGTIRILQTYRGMISDLLQKKGGRVVDSPRDNVLAEFASVVDALESAVEIQRELKIRNADRSESRRMEFLAKLLIAFCKAHHQHRQTQRNAPLSQ